MYLGDDIQEGISPGIPHKLVVTAYPFCLPQSLVQDDSVGFKLSRISLQPPGKISANTSREEAWGS